MKKRQAEKQEGKLPVCTSGGPTMVKEDAAEVRRKFKNQQMLTKLNLEKQMQMEKAERKALKDIDKDYERQDADMIAAMHIEAKEHRKN